MKTLEEIRNEIAVKYGSTNWVEYLKFMITLKTTAARMTIVFDEIAKTYHEQFIVEQPKTEPLQGGEIKDIIDCILEFDENETLQNKGEYFGIIQRDLKKALEHPKTEPLQGEERDFKCSKCGKGFNNFDALAWHKT